MSDRQWFWASHLALGAWVVGLWLAIMTVDYLVGAVGVRDTAKVSVGVLPCWAGLGGLVAWWFGRESGDAED